MMKIGRLIYGRPAVGAPKRHSQTLRIAFSANGMADKQGMIQSRRGFLKSAMAGFVALFLKPESVNKPEEERDSLIVMEKYPLWRSAADPNIHLYSLQGEGQHLGYVDPQGNAFNSCGDLFGYGTDQGEGYLLINQPHQPDLRVAKNGMVLQSRGCILPWTLLSKTLPRRLKAAAALVLAYGGACYKKDPPASVSI